MLLVLVPGNILSSFYIIFVPNVHNFTQALFVQYLCQYLMYEHTCSSSSSKQGAKRLPYRPKVLCVTDTLPVGSTFQTHLEYESTNYTIFITNSMPPVLSIRPVITKQSWSILSGNDITFQYTFLHILRTCLGSFRSLYNNNFIKQITQLKSLYLVLSQNLIVEIVLRHRDKL